MFNHITSILLPAIEHFGVLGYWVVFFAALSETIIGIGLLIPGSLLIFFLGTLASDGYLNIGDLMWFAIVGAILGDNVNYYIGRKYGRKVTKNGFLFLEKEHFKKAERFFKVHGAKSVFLGRFVPSVKEIVPFVAGTLKMNRSMFFIWNVLGAIGWGSMWLLGGYWFAQSLGIATKWLSRIEMFLVLVIVLVIAFFIARFLFMKKMPMIFDLTDSILHTLKEHILKKKEKE